MATRFDYTGALDLAVSLHTLADRADSAHSTRAVFRDVALDPTSFQGPYARRHREDAGEEDIRLGPSADACRATAVEWASAWRTAVDEYNDLAEAAARAQMRSYNDARRARYRLMVANFPDVVHVYPRMGYVYPARPAPVPSAPAFSPEPSFAHYEFGAGDFDVYPTYRGTP